MRRRRRRMVKHHPQQPEANKEQGVVFIEKKSFTRLDPSW